MKVSTAGTRVNSLQSSGEHGFNTSSAGCRDTLDRAKASIYQKYWCITFYNWWDFGNKSDFSKKYWMNPTLRQGIELDGYGTFYQVGSILIQIWSTAIWKANNYSPASKVFGPKPGVEADDDPRLKIVAKLAYYKVKDPSVEHCCSSLKKAFVCTCLDAYGCVIVVSC